MSIPVKIEKGVPLPSHSYGGKGGVPRSHPFWSMEVGDSIFFADDNVVRRQANILGYARAIRQRGCRSKFATRKVTENGIRGVRVWRVE